MDLIKMIEDLYEVISDLKTEIHDLKDDKRILNQVLRENNIDFRIGEA